MEKKVKPEIPDAFLWLQDLPKQPAPERFSAEELIVCEKCGRSNAPTRMNCLYCGAVFAATAENSAQTRPILRKLESWEKGWSVIYLPDSEIDLSEVESAKIADFLRLENAEAEKIWAARRALPVALAASAAEASVVQNYLAGMRIKTAIVADADLQIDVLSHRVRRIEFADDYFDLHLLGKTDAPARKFYRDIKLIVEGAIFERQIENRELRKNKDEFEIKDSRETASDENLLEFYAADEKIGYRVSAKKFDFSCLGAEKKLLASENFGIFRDKLKTSANEAIFDDSYGKMRTTLNPIWSLEQRSESIGWQREGVGKISLENRLVISSAAQFLRYSRTLQQVKDSL